MNSKEATRGGDYRDTGRTYYIRRKQDKLCNPLYLPKNYLKNGNLWAEIVEIANEFKGFLGSVHYCNFILQFS